jgi:hypothetical protein
MINPLQILEHAGLLIHLHCASIIFEIDGKKVAIHGMGAVPERYARDVLLQWSPKPIKDAINILMLHQSVDPYIYSPLEPPSLKLEDLPEGFDLYVLGHMHWHEQKKFKSGTLLLPGGLIVTSAHKIEAEQAKGIFFFDGKELEFELLETQRKVFFSEFKYDATVKEQIEKFLEKCTNSEERKKPIVVIKVFGRGEQEVNFKEIVKKFEDKAIIRLSADIKREEIETQVKVLQLIREKKLSPEEYGLEILRESAIKLGCKLPIDDIFDLLVEGEIDLTYNILLGKQTTLQAKKEQQEEVQDKTKTETKLQKESEKDVKSEEKPILRKNTSKDGIFRFLGG